MVLLQRNLLIEKALKTPASKETYFFLLILLYPLIRMYVECGNRPTKEQFLGSIAVTAIGILIVVLFSVAEVAGAPDEDVNRPAYLLLWVGYLLCCGGGGCLLVVGCLALSGGGFRRENETENLVGTMNPMRQIEVDMQVPPQPYYGQPMQDMPVTAATTVGQPVVQNMQPSQFQNAGNTNVMNETGGGDPAFEQPYRPPAMQIKN